MADKPPASTPPASERPRRAIRRFRVEAVGGRQWDEPAERCAIGSHPSNDLVIDDSTVSRFHCELSIAGSAVRVRDLGSRNGVYAGAIQITDGMVPGGTDLRLGNSDVRIHVDEQRSELASSEHPAFGPLIGDSAIMREVFSQLEKIAATDATLLVQGETGTGKEGVAEAVHEASTRAAGPFIVVDCSAIPANLLESELFGHEAGAFTGATERRIGAFEQASGGTLFLDEIGELPIDLQPKLLRALESRVIRRLGGRAAVNCDLRIIAATNRDLRAEVNRGAFRPDLYFRLAVVKVELPPLRERSDDIPLLVSHLLQRLGAPAATIADLTQPDYLALLAAASWPGNVRELRNHLEQCVVFAERRLPNGPRTPHPSSAIDARVSFDVARRQVLDNFERSYVLSLLELHQGNVTAAARASGTNRAFLYRLLRRHSLR
jgi:two-component system, NtrC family, response regulator GlrR